MIYRALRWVSGIMLHWFYSDIRLEGANNIPANGPILVAVNHPNALVDSLVAGWLLPHRLRMTAKATLASNPLIAVLFKLAGVVPLSRASDEAKNGDGARDRLRNQGAFDQIIEALRRGGSVLIFPEGRSHSEGALMPLRTGLARIALQARVEGVRGLSILPLGLSFEDKGTPGSRVLARAGQPIAIDSWKGDSPRDLTAAVAARLAEASAVVDFPEIVSPADGPPRKTLVRLATWWGRTTHDIPVRFARRLAVARSTDADQPAMLTMLFGMGLVLASYAVHLAVIGLITRSLLVSFLYLVTLVSGAYWTAFEGHRR